MKKFFLIFYVTFICLTAFPSFTQATGVSLVSYGATSGFGHTSSLVLTPPASIANGNLLIAPIVWASNVTVSAPAGWTVACAAQTPGSSRYIEVFQKFANNESGNYTFTASGQNFGGGSILQFSGMDATAPVDLCGTIASGATAPSITTTRNGDYIVYAVGSDGGGAMGIPASFTACGNQSAGADDGYACGYLSQGTKGATGTQAGSNPGSSYAMLFAVQPPGSPTLAITGCTTGDYGVASATCTVTASSGTFDGVHSVTITDSDTVGEPGTFTYSSTPYVGSFTVVPANAATTFAFTYTPAVVGTHTLTTTNNFSPMFNDATVSYVSTSAQPCTFTMTGSGTQSIAATSGWTSTGSCGHSAPTTGDALVATASGGALTITVPNDGVTHMLGSCPAANTTYDLQLTAVAAGSAVFDVQPGAKFYFCGNKLLTSVVTAAGSTPTVWADLKYETGATVWEDQAQAAYSHHTVIGAIGEWSRFLWGSSSDVCTYGPGVSYTCPTNVSTVNAVAFYPLQLDANSTYDNAIIKVYGTGIVKCGSTSLGCFNSVTYGDTTWNAYADANVISLGYDVFDTTGTVQDVPWGFGPGNRLTLTGNHFVNDLTGFGQLNGNSNGDNFATCTVMGNYFSEGFGNANNAESPCSFTGNVFAHGTPIASSASHRLAAYSGNVIFWDNAVGDPYVDRAISSPVLNNYLVNITNASGSNHGFGTGATNDYYQGNIFESPITGSSEGHCNVGGPGSATAIMLDNLSIPAANGVNTCQLYGWAGGGSSNVLWADHNGAYGIGDYSWFVLIGHTTFPYPSNQVLRSFRSNLGWSPTANSGNLALNSDQGGGAIGSAPNNNVDVVQETNNAWYNAASSSSFGAGVNANCDPSTSNGTPYDQCTASGTPGGNDITVNPKLLDPTRGLFKWASAFQGQPATLAGAEAAFQGCQNLSYCINQLETWVKAGYQPTNTALKGKAHDGRIVGFTGSYGSGYSGTCGVTITPQDTDDLGTGATATCSFVVGVPSIQITNPGMHYRVATPATVAITGTCTGGCVAASLTPRVAVSDPGPVPMTAIGSVE